MPERALEEQGYLHYVAKARDVCSAQAFSLLRREFSLLERDEYSPQGTNRFRRYANGIILPWLDQRTVNWLPPVVDSAGVRRAGYGQGRFNPDHAGMRNFHALSDEVKASPALLELIREDFALTFWPNGGHQFPIYVGVHFIKLTSPGPDRPGVSSPDCFHQDGEPFTFAHLIFRSPNSDGGVNFIGHPCLRDVSIEKAPSSSIKAQFTLAEPFDSFAVHDPKVTHYVSPIFKSKGVPGTECERCIILIDFCPTVQQI